MVAGAVSITLTNKRNSGVATIRGKASSVVGGAPPRAALRASLPFLRIPPFPGAKLQRFSSLALPERDAAAVADDLRHLAVGGSYWAAQPEVPSNCVIVRCPGALNLAREIAGDRAVVLWTEVFSIETRTLDVTHVVGDCDPWHMLAQASAVVAPDDEVRLIAALLGVPTYFPSEAELVEDGADLSELMADLVPVTRFANPFTRQPMSVREAIELCGFWRKLVDSNRMMCGGLGFAFWKQENVAPLLWDGSSPFRFLRSAADIAPRSTVAVWRAKAAPEVLADLERAGARLVEVEDGFLRSRGLGADCVPPLSITVDAMGAYFDPSRPSELERLLQEGSFGDALLRRATELRRVVVAAGIGKYEQGGAPLERRAGKQLHILVPGQVEDDRAVQTGGCGLTSNLELLKRVRAEAPGAYILYKPHPDVVAGHRRGAVVDSAVLELADEIVEELPIGSLIAMVDEVHVNTSLTGFEALLRGKKVTTYGVPFYAGWGLTKDLGPVPSRRSMRRSLDELVAAALLVYPRYLDPVSGLPCPAEVVVARLTASEASDPGLLVGMRRLQGKFMRRLRSLVQ